VFIKIKTASALSGDEEQAVDEDKEGGNPAAIEGKPALLEEGLD